MQCDTGVAAEQVKAMSDRLIALLRERLDDRTRQEIISSLDDIMPPFQIVPAEFAEDVDDRKLVYKLTDFLQYYGDEFIMITYLCIFKRSVDELGLAHGLQTLRSGRRSRIWLIGTLRYSKEGKEHGVEIEGLWFRYFLARLCYVPVLGKLIAALLNLGGMFRLDQEVQQQNAGISHAQRTLDAAGSEISEHFNDMVHRLTSAGYRLQEFAASSTTSTEGLGQQPASLAEFSNLHGKAFVRAIYLAVFRREASDTEIRAAMAQLVPGHKSKVRLLGDLYNSDEAQGSSDDIPGLGSAYRAEKLLSMPLIGPVLQLPRAFKMLSRMGAIVEHQSGEIASCNRRVSKMERRIMTHYNTTLVDLKHEMVEVLKEHPVQK